MQLGCVVTRKVPPSESFANASLRVGVRSWSSEVVEKCDNSVCCCLQFVDSYSFTLVLRRGVSGRHADVKERRYVKTRRPHRKRNIHYLGVFFNVLGYIGRVGLGEVLFPEVCFGCGVRGEYFCQACRGKMKGVEQICPECEGASFEGWVHEKCQTRLGLERLLVGFCYQGALRRGLKRVKYSSSWAVLEELGEMWFGRLGELVGEDLEGFEVVGVPMYRRKLKQRGFNQAERLGRMLAEEFGLEYGESLRRVRETRAQYGLGRREREENIKGAFEVREGGLPERVVLVDDVWTTGTTMRECCRVLKEGGVEEVWGVVIAR